MFQVVAIARRLKHYCHLEREERNDEGSYREGYSYIFFLFGRRFLPWRLLAVCFCH